MNGNGIFFMVISLAGGLGLFLYGMSLMSDGLKKTAGQRMRTILSRLTHNRFIAVGVGAFVTTIIQSSSATTVMLVSFVQAQLLRFAQTLGIILGAGIGTTITAQLIAFKLTDYALLVIAVGSGLLLLGKTHRLRNIGEALLGFGLLFFGMKIMSDAMVPLRDFDPFINLLVHLENPLLGILIGTVFTALIQSSSAFIGILIVLAGQGVLTLEAGIPLLLGANIGTCITAGLAAIGTTREAQRVAVAHILFKVVGVLLLVWWIPVFADLVRWLSPRGDLQLSGAAYLGDVVPRQIANAHTIFNIALTLILLPFTGPAARLVERLMPERPEAPEFPYKTRFIDNAMLATPVLALSLARQEVLRMGQIAKTMVEKILLPFTERNREVLSELDAGEEQVDFLQAQINAYLTRISQQSIPEEQADEAFRMMYTVTEFEQIADIVSKTLKPRALEWLETEHHFSEAGKQEIMTYHISALKQISRAMETFLKSDLRIARKMKRKFKKYRLQETLFMRTHYERLREDIPDSLASSEYHQELLAQFRYIASHATNIARILLELSEETPENHEAQNRDRHHLESDA